MAAAAGAVGHREAHTALQTVPVDMEEEKGTTEIPNGLGIDDEVRRKRGRVYTGSSAHSRTDQQCALGSFSATKWSSMYSSVACAYSSSESCPVGMVRHAFSPICQNGSRSRRLQAVSVRGSCWSQVF